MSREIMIRIRRAVRRGRYLITDHALDEAGFDDLLEGDILEILLNGKLDSIYADDWRGTRYVIRGEIEELELDVVCRFQEDGNLLIIITVYLAD